MVQLRNGELRAPKCGTSLSLKLHPLKLIASLCRAQSYFLTTLVVLHRKLSSSEDRPKIWKMKL